MLTSYSISPFIEDVHHSVIIILVDRYCLFKGQLCRSVGLKKDCLHLVLTTVSGDPITSGQLRQTAVYTRCLHASEMCLLWPLVIRFHDGQGLWYVTYNASVLLLAVKVAKVNTLLQMWCFSQNEHCCFSASVKFQLISWMKTRLWGIKYSLYNLLYLIFCLLKQKHLVFYPTASVWMSFISTARLIVHPKWQLCHHLLILMSFQAQCLIIFKTEDRERQMKRCLGLHWKSMLQELYETHHENLYEMTCVGQCLFN